MKIVSYGIVGKYLMASCNFLKYKKNLLLHFAFFDLTLRERIGLINHILKNLFSIKRIPCKKTQGTLVNTFVINLEFRNDRKNHILRQFKYFSLPFSFFKGVEGQILTPEQRRFFTLKSFQNLTKGSLGCAASHLEVMNKIQDYKDGLFLILEDDIVLPNNFDRRLLSYLTDVPIDADIIFLGSGNSRKRDIDYFVDSRTFLVYNYRKGTYCYLISPNGARKILSLLPIDLIYGGIDTFFGQLIRKNKIKAYHHYPSLIKVDSNFSSNIFNPSSRKKLHERAVKK